MLFRSPFLTRQLCSQTIRNLERPGRVDTVLAARAIKEYLRLPDNYLAESLWGVDSGGPPAMEAELLKSLAANQPQPEDSLIPDSLPPDEQRAHQLALNHLHDQRLLCDQYGWRFTIPLYRRWIHHYVLNLPDETRQ